MEILVNTYRGDLLDLFYTGSIAVVDSQGKLLYSAGDVDQVAYARSSAKLIQTMVVLKSGANEEYHFTQQEIAQMCASHNGEEIHLKTVKGILDKIGLDESYLQCGTHYSINPKLADHQKATNYKLTALNSNCSGKHSGMLATVKHLGEDLDTYYQKDHPHQQRILDLIAQVCQVPKEEIVIGLDGCGVPVHAMKLKDFAHGFARLAKPETLGEEYADIADQIVKAVMAYPLNVAGEGKLDTKLMEKYPNQIFVKQGADGYYAGGFPDKGIAFAIKIDNSSDMAKELVLIEMLRQMDFIKPEDLAYFESELAPKVYNHKKEMTGNSLPAFTLKKHF